MTCSKIDMVIHSFLLKDAGAGNIGEASATTKASLLGPMSVQEHINWIRYYIHLKSSDRGVCDDRRY